MDIEDIVLRGLEVILDDYEFFFFFFFERESFNLWCPLLMIAIYYQTKTPISFWCRRGLNSRSLIQPSETIRIQLKFNFDPLLRFRFNIYIYIYIYYVDSLFFLNCFIIERRRRK